MTTRLQKAIDLINGGYVTKNTKYPEWYRIQSGDKFYNTRLYLGKTLADHLYSCDCKWGRAQKQARTTTLTNACSHAWAVAGVMDVAVLIE